MPMKKIISGILFLFLTLSCDVVPIEKYLELAAELENQGRYEEAIEFHNKALKKDPEFRPSLINRGADKAALKDFEGAIEDYKTILEFDSDNALALINVANNYERLNQYKKAIKYYTIALEKGNISRHVKIVFNTTFDNDSQYLVDEADIIFQRGLNYILDKQYENAKIDLEKCIELEYLVGDSYFYLGEICRKQNDKENACKNYKISAEIGISNAKEQMKNYCDNK